LTAIGVTLGVVGLAGVAGGGFASYKVQALQKEIESAKLGQLSTAKLNAQQDQASRYQSWQWVGYGAGTAVLVVGIVFLVLNGRPDTDDQARGPQLTASVAGGGAQVGLQGRF
jgi:hypothetical protein